MAQSFIGRDREQAFLMPPDVREWLPEGHLAWFVIDAVAAMDLHEFYAAYRLDGRSRPAYEPSMMVALLLYAYARGVRSARAIERGCEEDVAYRVIAAQQKPDHATIARFGRAPSGRARWPVRVGARALRAGGPGERRRCRDRWHEAACERQSRGDARLRTDRARDRRGGQGGRRGRGRALWGQAR